MTPEVPSLQIATESVHSLQQRWLSQGETLPDPVVLEQMILNLETIAVAGEASAYDHPAQLCRQIQSILRQLGEKQARITPALLTQISEGLGTLAIMIQALSVSEGPALSVLERLSEGISTTLTKAEQHLQH